MKHVPTTQVDRPAATKQRCGEVESGLFDLFAMMGATEEQLDFPVLYASAREVRNPRQRMLPLRIPERSGGHLAGV